MAKSTQQEAIVTAMTLSPDGSLQIGTHCQLTRTGLQITGTLTFEEWDACGHVLMGLGNACRWALGDWLLHGEGGRGDWGEMYSQALDHTKKSYQSLMDTVWVAKAFDQRDTDGQFSRRRENLSWSHHKEVAGLSERQQDHWLTWSEHQGTSHKELREAIRDVRHAERTIHRAWPAGQYGLIYCVPPMFSDASDWDHAAAYAEDIKGITASDCVLALWSTPETVAESCRLIDVWGFAVQSSAVWVTDQAVMGDPWFRQRHEILLLATTGSPETPSDAVRPDSVIQAPRLGERDKPDQAYDYLEAMFQGVPKVELFHRGAQRDGWDSWGNE